MFQVQVLYPVAGLVAMAASRVRRVRKSEMGVYVKRNGDASVRKPGVLLLPPTGVTFSKVNMDERQGSFTPTMMATRDDDQIVVSGTVLFKVHDPITATLKVTDAEVAVAKLAQTMTREKIALTTAELARGDEEKLSAEVQMKLNEVAGEKWGIDITSIRLRVA